MYGKYDQARFTAKFGRGLHPEDPVKDEIIVALLNALDLFEHAHDRISAEMNDFLDGLEKLRGPDDPAPEGGA
jgi:hypothetical protein